MRLWRMRRWMPGRLLGSFKYYVAAKGIGDAMLARFYDATGGGFFDTELDADAIGALSARRKPLQDSPTPAGNATAATVLLRLPALTGEAAYEARAQETLETFAGIVEHFGLYAASYGLALRRAVGGPVQVCAIGDDARAEELAVIAMARYAVNKSVIRLRRDSRGVASCACGDVAASAGEGGKCCCGVSGE